MDQSPPSMFGRTGLCGIPGRLSTPSGRGSGRARRSGNPAGNDEERPQASNWLTPANTAASGMVASPRSEEITASSPNAR